MKAADFMSSEVATCRTSDSLEQAAQLMSEGRLGCLPVVDQMETVVGMLTDRDVCLASYAQRRMLGEIPVTAAMSRPVVTCYPSTTVDEVRHLMAAHRIRRIPVVDADGCLLGLVSLSDLARRAARSDVEPGIELDEVALTLATVTDHPT